MEEKFYYAELNDENICTSVGQYPCNCDGEKFIKLDEVNPNLLGCRYDDGVWTKIERKKDTYVSEADIMQAQLLLNQMTIIENQNYQDEVLAEILLNQAETALAISEE